MKMRTISEVAGGHCSSFSLFVLHVRLSNGKNVAKLSPPRSLNLHTKHSIEPIIQRGAFSMPRGGAKGSTSVGFGPAWPAEAGCRGHCGSPIMARSKSRACYEK